MFDFLENPPAWAYTYCYYFLAIGFVSYIAFYFKVRPFYMAVGPIGMFLIMILGIIAPLGWLTAFWACRSSLKHLSA